jgi:hypothetical protein
MVLDGGIDHQMLGILISAIANVVINGGLNIQSECHTTTYPDLSLHCTVTKSSGLELAAASLHCTVTTSHSVQWFGTGGGTPTLLPPPHAPPLSQ